MSILVVGSVAFDSLETPHGNRERVLGGTAVNFSVAASFFAPVHIIGVAGSDFGEEHVRFLMEKGVDITGLKIDKNGKTFHWHGRYHEDINQRDTLKTDLGVFENFDPELSPSHCEKPFVFLAGIIPSLQLKVLDQIKCSKLVAMDTWMREIEMHRNLLQKVIERSDMIFINDEEGRKLTGELNITRAAKKILTWGPKTVVIKRGEYGATLYTKDMIFSLPGYPLAKVIDPTGAGDTFAGGFLGYLAKIGKLDDKHLKRAMVYGSAMASFDVEDFSIDRLRTLTMREIKERAAEFKKLSHFDL
jgi:sugar/nucleoside kinase (ribokinase family)